MRTVIPPLLGTHMLVCRNWFWILDRTNDFTLRRITAEVFCVILYKRHYVPMMRTRAKLQFAADDRARRGNVQNLKNQ